MLLTKDIDLVGDSGSNVADFNIFVLQSGCSHVWVICMGKTSC